MLSPRRRAQLCLGAATLMLVTCITLLVAGAADSGNRSSIESPAADSGHITPLATGQLGNLQTDRLMIGKP